MVFMKNPVKGKVKTRLAATIGNDNALEIYKMLLQQTAFVISTLNNCDKAIFYSDFVDENDLWGEHANQKYLQNGIDLGARMNNAFDFSFKNGYEKIIIIGTDCYDLKSEIIENGFEVLNKSNVVIGPATDGGYYLLGMKQLHQKLFENILWSTENVLNDTIQILKKSQLTYHLLPVLSDIDTEENLHLIDNLKTPQQS